LRWFNNLSINFLNVIIVRGITPITVVIIAARAETSSVGLFNIIDMHTGLSIVLSVLLLDLAIYIQHVIFHKVEFLWRLHRMHHADLDFDLTTGIRFHPIEIILSLIIKIGVVLVIGAPALAVLIFEIVLNSSSLFNHANIRIPYKVDKILRLFIVTPDMHRVHHSVIREETDSNFGFNLTWWDYLFRTYRAQPKKGHLGMDIGIELFREKRELWLDRLLLQPFKNK
jgi:sterol desaturase/sphingolipid hydroxylase (fatty acid hydroxylase superfamily)